MPAPPPRHLDADARLRYELAALLVGRQAHVDAATVLGGVPAEALNERAGTPHSLWDIAWHLRFTLADILLFVRDPDYAEPAWPDAYWPAHAGDADAYAAEVAAFLADTEALDELTRTAALTAELPHAPGYSILREILVAADHAAYHLGEAVALRRRLGLWPA